MDTIKMRVLDQLEELSALEPMYYKALAYGNAVQTLRSMPDKEFISREDFTDLYGIGVSINAKILECRSTGVISKLLTLRAESSDYLDSHLYKVREGFVTKKVTYEYATTLIYDLREFLEVPFTVAGSYRRKCSRIGDLDILTDEQYYDEVCKKMMNNYKVVSSGDYKSQFLLDTANNVPVDILKCNKDDFSFQLLYLTGSREMNIKMRKIASKRLLLLNQYGLYDRTDSSEIRVMNGTEEDIFKFLNIEYVTPENR